MVIVLKYEITYFSCTLHHSVCVRGIAFMCRKYINSFLTISCTIFDVSFLVRLSEAVSIPTSNFLIAVFRSIVSIRYHSCTVYSEVRGFDSVSISSSDTAFIFHERLAFVYHERYTPFAVANKVSYE